MKMKYNDNVRFFMGLDAAVVFERLEYLVNHSTVPKVEGWTKQSSKSIWESLGIPKRTFFLVVKRLEEAQMIERKRGQNITLWKVLIPHEQVLKHLQWWTMQKTIVKGRTRRFGSATRVSSGKFPEVQQGQSGSATTESGKCNKGNPEVQQEFPPIYERVRKTTEKTNSKANRETTEESPRAFDVPPSTEKKAMPTKTKTKTEDLSSVQIPDWMDPERWEDYIGHREDIKQALSARSARSTIRVLQEWVDLDNGNPKRAMSLLDQVIASGKWTAPWAPSAKDKPFISQYKPKQRGMTDEELANWEPPKSCRDTPKIKIIN